ncbi:radical SAM protein [Clostridium sp. MSJ-8]|uniref:radical SAM/SPASM domain-containing protein n=1 Tax=Clostridium sp. MSJ-8 TaxID=2841510 RepID=UPI001C0F38E9|nr:radical SAM protein [Clostridium sp. MSJ-8]MBU5488945.1 radical SAM protein [Clostridium sp. MSJ-8]
MNKTVITSLKSQLLMQLHVTGRCNQKCKHCYHNEYVDEPLTLDSIRNIINQYVELLDKYNKVKNINCMGHINVTGGEPFVRKDFFDILEMFYENRRYFSFGVLTNGSYITDENAKLLKELGVSNVQVSIDGDKEIHDYIRGQGNYDQTFEAVDKLRKNNIRTTVSFTASKLNYKKFPDVAKACKEHDVSRLWSDRIVPIGNGSMLKEQCLSAPECLELFKIMKEEQDKALAENSNTEIFIKRALQFIVTKKDIYGCSAGDTALTIDEYGNILPCRRMPIKCGNVLKENLSDVYFNSEIMNDLRKKEVCKECEQCRFRNNCNGGAKCISYAINKDYKIADPFCPLIFYRRNKN